jgi:hypothetical protein
MTRRLLFPVLVIGVMVSAIPVIAHHSISAEFDTTRTVTFTGPVKALEWGSPHIYTQVEAKDAAGKVHIYRVEGGPPNSLFRSGWRKEDLKVGTIVTVTGNPAKSPTSENIGQATIKTADGKTVFSGTPPVRTDAAK